MSLRRDDFGEAIATAEFDLQPADGPKRRVVARVGRPYLVSELEWACPVELQGFEPRYPDLRGVTALQALCLAIVLVRSRLADCLRKGDQLFEPTEGAEWSLEDLSASFGHIGDE